jgi:ankyrin repeat protein
MQWIPTETTAIVDTCITYLSFDSFKEGPCRDSDGHKSRLNQYKLLNYAAKNWGHHLSDQHSLAETERTTTDTVLSFLEDASLTCSGSEAMDIRDERLHEDMYGVYSGTKAMGIREVSGFHEGMYGVHLTASFGLEHLTMLLIEKQQDADIQDRYGRTPLWWAATNGNAGLVKTLLGTRSVDYNNREPIGRPMTDGRFRFGIGQTPLSKAAENGHNAVVKMLIANHEVNVDAADLCERTPLSYAAQKGHEAIVQMLLDTKVVRIDEEKDRFGLTPLMYAAKGGHKEVVKALLTSGMDNINSKDLLGCTPLMYAARGGHEAVVKALLAIKNIDTHVKDCCGKTAYGMALMYQNHSVAALLMAAEADATSKDYDSTPELDNEQGKRKQHSSEGENKQTSKKQKLSTDDGT